MSDTTMFRLSGGDMVSHGCRKYALGISGVERKNFHGSIIVGKSHYTPSSVLCLDGTTTPGPYAKTL